MRKKVERKDVAAELMPGADPALLQALHLLTRDGDLNADSRRKVKQINHLIGLLRPGLDDVLARFPNPVVVDAGAGKSYLGFLLYQLVLGPAAKGELYGVESRPELAQKAGALAAQLGFSRFHSVESELHAAPLPERVHLVTALHACDTATDDALLLALKTNADYVAVVPCCQAEVAQQLKAHPASGAIGALSAHPWHRRELGSHLTNVIRALVLEAHGYQVTVTELAGWEHSLKNELILGKRVQRFDRAAQAKLDQLLSESGVRPKLVRELPSQTTAQALE